MFDLRNNIMENGYFEPYSEVKLENLDFDGAKLSFNVVQYTYKPKIIRYVQRNYEKTPIYDTEPSVSSKILKRFNKVVNVPLFCETQIRDLDLPIEFKSKICDKLDYCPQWLNHYNKIQYLKNQEKEYSKQFKTFYAKSYNFKPVNAKEEPSNVLLYVLLTLITFGFIWLTFVSKKQAELNKKNNEANKIYNAQHRIYIDKINQENKTEIINYNHQLELKIRDIKEQINKEKDALNNIKLETDEEGWSNLREAFKFDNRDELYDVKGIYIIWNKTKNKYYVGQSKNLYTRIFRQHFNNSDVKNIIFAKDWYANDEFYFRYEICETKDELDRLEKHYIEYYNAFEEGYNQTGGNK